MRRGSPEVRKDFKRLSGQYGGFKTRYQHKHSPAIIEHSHASNTFSSRPSATSSDTAKKHVDLYDAMSHVHAEHQKTLKQKEAPKKKDITKDPHFKAGYNHGYYTAPKTLGHYQNQYGPEDTRGWNYDRGHELGMKHRSAAQHAHTVALNKSRTHTHDFHAAKQK